MEDIVSDALPSVLRKYPEVCTCTKCIIDIKAIALNNLKPQYTATENGEVYIRLLMSWICNLNPMLLRSYPMP